MTKIIGSFVGGFIIGLILILGWNAFTDSRLLKAPAQTTTPNDIQIETTQEAETGEKDTVTNEDVTQTPFSTHITVEDQEAGSAVIVGSVTLSEDGWIVVHEENAGRIGNALGAKRKDAGTHQNTVIPLLRDTQQSIRYWIVLYSDDGDRQFNLSTDFPLRDEVNNPITSSFMAR